MKKFNYRKRINSCLPSAGQFKVKLDNEFDFDEKQNYNKSLNFALCRTVNQGEQTWRTSVDHWCKIQRSVNYFLFCEDNLDCNPKKKLKSSYFLFKLLFTQAEYWKKVQHYYS